MLFGRTPKVRAQKVSKSVKLCSLIGIGILQSFEGDGGGREEEDYVKFENK